MTKRAKMSKSSGNAIGVDEVVYGVASVDDGYEFRTANGTRIAAGQVRELGVWRDRAGSGDYFTSERFGKRPVFVHQVGDPEPCLFAVDGGVRSQHPCPNPA